MDNWWELVGESVVLNEDIFSRSMVGGGPVYRHHLDLFCHTKTEHALVYFVQHFAVINKN